MDRIELRDYELARGRTGHGLRRFNFAIRRGQTCAVHADEPNDVYLFLRALATLVRPESGTYRFFGHNLDFSDYRRLLPWKRKISYIGRNSAMLSNLTIRENLLLERAYFENSLSLELSDQVMWFCRTFNLTDKLDLRPAALNPLNLRIAIAIRELNKPCDILIMDGPEDIFGHPKFHYFIERVHSMTADGIPFVYFSESNDFIRSFSGRQVRIDRGVLHQESPEPGEGTTDDHGY
jgi:ABC-type sugar transport system ATPase subunit